MRLKYETTCVTLPISIVIIRVGKKVSETTQILTIFLDLLLIRNKQRKMIVKCLICMDHVNSISVTNPACNQFHQHFTCKFFRTKVPRAAFL